MKLFIAITAAAVATLLASALPASASSLALDHTGGSTSSFSAGSNTFTAGWQFIVNVPIRVDALGLFDVGADGFAHDHTVGIFDNAGSLLTSTSITSASPLVASASTLGDWRFENITPIDLALGTHRIGSTFMSADVDKFVIDAIPGNILEITYVAGRFGLSATDVLVDPDLGNSPGVADPSFFGPTFSIPEPATLGLLTLGGAAVFIRRGRGVKERTK